jgi:DNA-binding SARP family transcriptional activator
MWAQAAEPHLTRPEQGVWTKQFESQQEHFRAALRWACTSAHLESGFRLANALTRFWMTGSMVEGRTWFEELLRVEENLRQANSSPVSALTRAWALFGSGRLAVTLGEDAAGARRGEEALALFRSSGDTLGTLNALNVLALAAQDTNDYAQALACYDQALTISRQTNNARMTAVLLINQGLMYYEQQDYCRTAPLWEEAFAIAERLEDYSIWMLDDLGCLAMMQGDYAHARSILERDVRTGHESGNKLAVAVALMDLGETLRRQGDLNAAETLLKEALERHQQMSNPARVGETLVNLANLERNRGQLSSARNLFESSLLYLQQSNYSRYISHVKMNLGVLEVLQGHDNIALPFLRESLRLAQQGHHRLCRVEVAEEIAGVWLREGKAPHAARLFSVAAVERAAIGAPVPPVERARYDQMSDSLRAALGDDAFAAIEAAARNLTLEPFIVQILGSEATTHPPVVAIQEPALRVFALGTSRVIVGGRTLSPRDWKYSKAKELFFYLLSNPPATKAQIGLDLWQDASPAQLRNIFHRALHYLRKALGHPEWIVYEDEAYTFDRHINYWSDLGEFEARLKEAQTLYKSGLPPPTTRTRAIECLEDATQLWRGDFLEDIDAGDWAIFRRENLRQAFLQGLLDLAQLYLAEARYADAVTTLQRMLAFDNYLEVAHRELMRAYARQGDAARAVRHYGELRRLMREELGAEPSAETMLLYERLKRGDDI